MDEVTKVISPPPDTLGNCGMAFNPIPQARRVHHLPGLQASYQSTPITREEDSIRLYFPRDVCAGQEDRKGTQRAYRWSSPSQKLVSLPCQLKVLQHPSMEEPWKGVTQQSCLLVSAISFYFLT